MSVMLAFICVYSAVMADAPGRTITRVGYGLMAVGAFIGLIAFVAANPS